MGSSKVVMNDFESLHSPLLTITLKHRIKTRKKDHNNNSNFKI